MNEEGKMNLGESYKAVIDKNMNRRIKWEQEEEQAWNDEKARQFIAPVLICVIVVIITVLVVLLIKM